jgi:hypothetical protein
MALREIKATRVKRAIQVLRDLRVRKVRMATHSSRL